MNIHHIVVLIIVLIAPCAWASDETPLLGESNQVALEKGLCNHLPGYVRGIYPRRDILSKEGVPKSMIPVKYTDHIQDWLKVTLNTKYLPIDRQWPQWIGLKKLRWDQNYIVGSWSVKNEDEVVVVQVQATDRTTGITVLTNKVINNKEFDHKQIVAILSKYLAIPDDKINQCQVEASSEKIADHVIVYGKMRCNWNERENEETDRYWWSYVPFWISNNRIFMAISTINWQSQDRPSKVDEWDF